MTTSISSTTSSISTSMDNLSQVHYPAEGLRQFNEMTIPRDVAGEQSHKLIEKEKAASQELTNKLSLVTDQEIKHLLKVINTLDFKNAPKDSVLLNSKLPHIALEALRRGLLDPQHGQNQVATILSFWAALQYHQDPDQLETLSISDYFAKIAIAGTLNHSQHPHAMEPFLDEDKMDLFMEKMRALPPSEQRFLIVPDIQGGSEGALKTTVSQAVRNTGINVFNRFERFNRSKHDATPMRMVASAGMMQAFLDAQYGPDAVKIKPRIYLSTLRHIYDTRLTDTCDLMVPTPDAEGKSRCPSTADGFQAPWYDFTYHDFYHCILTSAIGRTYRKVGIVASDAIRTYAKTAPDQDRKGLGQLAVSMIDMEYPLFHHYTRKILWLFQEQIFWITISQQISAQKQKYDGIKELEKKGVPAPIKADLISEESELGVFNALYNTFVHEKQGTPKLNEESFKTAAKAYKNKFLEDRTKPLDHPILRLEEHLNTKESSQ